MLTSGGDSLGRNSTKESEEILDLINKDGVDYLVTLQEDSEDEVVILEVTPIDGDDENVEYTEVIDDELGDEIFNEFIKRQDETEE